MQQISLKKILKPHEKNIDEDIKWICDSFCVSSGRDIEMTASKIIKEVIKKYPGNNKLSSDIIAEDLDLTQSIVNHHLRSIIASGLIYREKRLIFLTGGSLKAAVQEIRKDTNRLLDEIEGIAEDIDNVLGLRNRN